MKNLTKVFIGAAALLALTSSCNSYETDTKTTQGFQNCYAIITDINKGTVTVSEPVTVGLELNWSKITANASFSGFVIDGSTYPLMIVSDFGWTTNDLWAYSTSNPNAQLTTGINPKISDFKFQWSDRVDIPGFETTNAYDPAFLYSFNLDERYIITGSRTPFNLWGTTTAAAQGVEPFTSEVNNIVATPDFKNMTMTVLVTGAQFAEKMPALDIQLDNIPMKFVDNGKSFTFEAENLIPSIAGTPYPNYPCSNIHGTLDPSTGMTFSFDCNVLQRMTYTVTTNPTVFGYR